MNKRNKYVVVWNRLPSGRGYSGVLSESGDWAQFGKGGEMVFTGRPTDWELRTSEDEVISLEEYEMLVMEREIK